MQNLWLVLQYHDLTLGIILYLLFNTLLAHHLNTGYSSRLLASEY